MPIARWDSCFDETTESNRRFLTLARKGLSWVEVANELGISQSAARNRAAAARKRGLLPMDRNATPMFRFDPDNALNVAVLADVKAGVPYYVIGAKYGRSKDWVSYLVWRARGAGAYEALEDKPRTKKEALAWERLRAELVEQHRREFIDRQRVETWARDGGIQEAA